MKQIIFGIVAIAATVGAIAPASAQISWNDYWWCEPIAQIADPARQPYCDSVGRPLRET